MIPFVVLFVIFAIHVIGAGDVKLLCGIGAYAGDDIWKILTYTCVMTGVAALIKGVAFRTPRMGLQAEGWMYGMKQHTRMHLSVPIAFGCVWYAVIKNNDLGREFYNWLINPLDKVKLIDFDNIENNDFAVVDELPFSIIEDSSLWLTV